MDADLAAKFIPPDSGVDPTTFSAGFEAGHVWTLIAIAERQYDISPSFGFIVQASSECAESMLLIAEDLGYHLQITEKDDDVMEMIFTHA